MYTKSDDIRVMLHASISHHQGCANLPLCQPAPLSPTGAQNELQTLSASLQDQNVDLTSE